MRIVYMGTPEFALHPLVALHQSKHQVAAVVTGQDKPHGRGRKLKPTAMRQQAEEFGLTVLTPKSLKSESFYEQLKELAPDLTVVVAFRILPERLITLAKHGSINIHASLLPKYRGAAPIQWALINGEKETGLTSFFLKKKVDTGDVILQEKTKIDDNENYDSLSARLSHMAGPFLLKAIDLIESGSYCLSRQDEAQASPAPKIDAEDAMIDFGFPAQNVHNFIRGLSSRPGAYTIFRGKKVKVLSTRQLEIEKPDSMPPGTIIPRKGLLQVQCAGSVIEVTEVVPEGKKAMDGRSFVNGFRPKAGESFGKALRNLKGQN